MQTSTMPQSSHVAVRGLMTLTATISLQHSLAAELRTGGHAAIDMCWCSGCHHKSQQSAAGVWAAASSTDHARHVCTSCRQHCIQA